MCTAWGIYFYPLKHYNTVYISIDVFNLYLSYTLFVGESNHYYNSLDSITDEYYSRFTTIYDLIAQKTLDIIIGL